MALPFLIEEEILTTFFEINLELNGLTNVELQLVNSFKILYENMDQWN